MLSIFQASREPKSEFEDSVEDLLASYTRKLMLGIVAIYLLWLSIGVGSQAGHMTLEIMPTTFAIAVSFSLAYWLIPRRLTIAQSVWLLGSVIAITLALLNLRIPRAGFFLRTHPNDGGSDYRLVCRSDRRGRCIGTGHLACERPGG